MNVTRRLYHKVRTETEVCAYGEKHEIGIYVVKVVEDTGRTWEREYYGTMQERIWVDRQGREYWTYSPTDFYGGAHFKRMVDNLWFDSRTDKLARDISGNPLTPQTPRG